MGSSGLPLPDSVLDGRFENGHPYGNPPHPVGYPWSAFGGIPFRQPRSLLLSVRMLSRGCLSRYFPFGPPCFSCQSEFGLTLSQNRLGPAFKLARPSTGGLVFRRHVTDRTVQPPGIVMVHKIGHDGPGVGQRQRCMDANARTLDRLVAASLLEAVTALVKGGRSPSNRVFCHW